MALVSSNRFLAWSYGSFSLRSLAHALGKKMSDLFSKGDRVKFQHWLVENQIMVGTVFDMYKVMGETYLVVKTDDNCTYHPNESRCSLEIL